MVLACRNASERCSVLNVNHSRESIRNRSSYQTPQITSHHLLLFLWPIRTVITWPQNVNLSLQVTCIVLGSNYWLLTLYLSVCKVRVVLLDVLLRETSFTVARQKQYYFHCSPKKDWIRKMYLCYSINEHIIIYWPLSGSAGSASGLPKVFNLLSGNPESYSKYGVWNRWPRWGDYSRVALWESVVNWPFAVAYQLATLRVCLV